MPCAALRLRSAPAERVLSSDRTSGGHHVDAVGVAAAQDFDGVPGPLGDERRWCPGVEPPGDARVPEVVGLVCQERGLLGLGEGQRSRLLEHSPERGRQVDATLVGLEQATIPRRAEQLEVLADHLDQDGQDRDAADGVARAALGPAGFVDLAVIGPVASGC